MLFRSLGSVAALPIAGTNRATRCSSLVQTGPPDFPRCTNSVRTGPPAVPCSGSLAAIRQPNFPSCRRKSLRHNDRPSDFSTTFAVEKIFPPAVDAAIRGVPLGATPCFGIGRGSPDRGANSDILFLRVPFGATPCLMLFRVEDRSRLADMPRSACQETHNINGR